MKPKLSKLPDRTNSSFSHEFSRQLVYLPILLVKFIDRAQDFSGTLPVSDALSRTKVPLFDTRRRFSQTEVMNTRLWQGNVVNIQFRL